MNAAEDVLFNNAEKFDPLKKKNHPNDQNTLSDSCLKFQLSSAITYMEHLIPQLPDKWRALYFYFSETIGFNIRKETSYRVKAVL